MARLPVRSLAVFSLVALAGCASNPPARRVWVGPHVDLHAYEVIGMVQFTSSSKGELGAVATRRFAEAARRDQDMLRMVEIGSPKQALASTGGTQWTAEACRAIGRQNGVKSMFRGTLTVSKVRPSVQLSALFRSGQVTATVDATLEVEMIESETGASIWSRSASATRPMGQVSVYNGHEFGFDAADPDTAYGDLVDALVSQVTRDFQGYWTTQQ
jgi:nitrogen regulatory protein PII